MTESMTPGMQTYHIITYGCQMNVYDSHRMADALVPAFPNRAGQHLNHLNGTYASASCSTCHTYGNGSVNHGWSNRIKSTDASASIGGSVSGWSPGTRASGQGTCLTTNCSGKPHNDAASFHWY